MKRLLLTSALFLLLTGLTGLHAQTYNGYTLYSKMGNNKVYLLNMDKTIYKSWTVSPVTGYSTYLKPNKHIVRGAQYSGNILQGAAMCGMVQDVDWNGNVAWQYTYSTSTYCSHHDICVMPNGNVLLIAYEVKTPAEVTQAGCSQSITMWPDKIVEIQPSGTSGGTVVWEWHAWDHLCQNLYPAKDNYVTSISQHPELLNINYGTQKDWMHTNGIDYNAELDQIIISSHHLNEVYVIDHSTTTAQAAGHTGGNSGKGGDILYRWGNPQVYSCGTSSNQIFKVVHDAHWVPYDCPNGGDIVGFNNEGITGGHSCIDRITPPYSGAGYVTNPGSAFTPSTYSWRHACLSDSDNQSSSQQLPNGNTLVCIASTGYIYEINPSQALVWSFTAGGTIAQAFRYTDCYLNGNLTVTASSAANGVCSGSSVQLSSSANVTAGTTFYWYTTPAGYTSILQNPVVSPTVTTKYYVTATNGSCSSTDSVTITVNNPISATATAGSNSICAGNSTQLNASANGGSSYLYSWSSNPAGFSSSLQNPTVSPGVTTTYTVIVTSGYCTASSSVTVNVSNPITVNCSANPGTIPMGGSSQLHAEGSGGTSYTYSWVSNPPGFTSNLQDPVVMPLTTTIYTVTAQSDACNANSSVTVSQSGIYPAISVTPSSVTVPGSPGTTDFNVVSNVSWTAQSNQTWCTVTTSGSGNGALLATCAENTDLSPRTAVITVSSNGAVPAAVTLIQEGIGPKTLNLVIFPEGLFNGSNLNKAYNENGPHYPGTVADMVSVELHQAATPYSLSSGPYSTELDISGTCSVSLPGNLQGNYYIIVKHRNSIETWSAIPVSFNANVVEYNFSDAISRAFGNNLHELNGKYLVYGGDVNQDGLIDSGDLIPIDNDATNFLNGYLPTDVNGDGLIDSGDMILVDNNSATFITRVSPE